VTGKDEREENYWRSAVGADAYRTAMEVHFQRLARLTKAVELIEDTSFDVMILQAFPEPDSFTAVTCGLSGFILPRPSNEDRAVRQELAWTVWAREDKNAVAALLMQVGHRILQRRLSLSEGEVIENVDFAQIGGSTRSVRHMLVTLDNVFERDEARIPNYFMGYIVELVAVTDAEAKLIEINLDDFFELSSAGKLDPQDLSR
jgi:hypothetical protein